MYLGEKKKKKHDAELDYLTVAWTAAKIAIVRYLLKERNVSMSEAGLSYYNVMEFGR